MGRQRPRTCVHRAAPVLLLWFDPLSGQHGPAERPIIASPKNHCQTRRLENLRSVTIRRQPKVVGFRPPIPLDTGFRKVLPAGVSSTPAAQPAVGSGGFAAPRPVSPEP